MTKARVQSQGRGPAGSKSAKKLSYFVDEDDSEDVESLRFPWRDCLCDLSDSEDCEEAGRDPREVRQMVQKDAVLVNGAPCIIHGSCCRKCHYACIELHKKSDCVCEQLLRLSGRISQSEFEKRKEMNTPFLAKGERCHHGICCVGCHFKLVHDERREQRRADVLEERREQARLKEEQKLERKAREDAKKKKLKREADMAEEREREARVRLVRRVEEWRAPSDIEMVDRTTAELSRGAPPRSAGRTKSKARSTKKGSETVDCDLAELSRGASPRPVGKTKPKATTTRKGTAGVQKTTSVRAPMSKATTGYDHRTIARDILRAAGLHPTLPPLNAHVMQRPGTR